jgi:hypothetical protein
MLPEESQPLETLEGGLLAFELAVRARRSSGNYVNPEKEPVRVCLYERRRRVRRGRESWPLGDLVKAWAGERARWKPAGIY